MQGPLELLWIDPRSVARIKKQPSWQHVIEAAGESTKPGRPALPGQDVSTADRLDVAAVLARGEALLPDGIAAALTQAIEGDGKLHPPLVLVGGNLWLPFDELSTLEITVSTAMPYVGGDEALKASIDAAQELLATPEVLAGPAVVEGLTTRIREAFTRAGRGPAGYLEAQTERALLEQRRYQKRASSGVPRIRGLLQVPNSPPILVYLPADASILPLQSRFDVRILAEAHLAVDAGEPHPFALEIRALARRIPQGASRG